MNTNSKILLSQDSNLSCYSPSTPTFSAPAFYLSSFMILVGGRFPFPQNTDIFYVMMAKGMTGASLPPPPPEHCPQQTSPGRLPPLKLPRGVWVRVGVRQFTRGNFPRSNSPSSSQSKGKPHFMAKFSLSKNRTVTWRNTYPSKRARWFQFVNLIL